jgi:hypothetical protein
VTAAPRPDALDIVDWGDGRRWRWTPFVVVAVLLGAAVTGSVANRLGAADERRDVGQVSVTALFLGADEFGLTTPVAARIRVLNDGPLPVTIRFLEVGLPGASAQAAAGSDRVDPADGRDVTIPLSTYERGAALGEATVRLEVCTADGRSRVVSLPLQGWVRE